MRIGFARALDGRLEGNFYVTTRHGKQFDFMIYSDVQTDCYDVLMNAEDAGDWAFKKDKPLSCITRIARFMVGSSSIR